jgi:ketosteroid isomerase-like protein
LLTVFHPPMPDRGGSTRVAGFRIRERTAASTDHQTAKLDACNPAAPAKPAVDTGKIADAVKADADQLIGAYNAHDATKAASHVTSDFVGMFHGVPNTVGSDASNAAAKQTFATIPDLHVTLSDETVDVAASGDLAVYHSTFVTTLTDPKTKKPVTDHGNYLAGYKAQPDGSWKQTWSVVSDTGPAPRGGARRQELRPLSFVAAAPPTPASPVLPPRQRGESAGD